MMIIIILFTANVKTGSPSQDDATSPASTTTSAVIASKKSSVEGKLVLKRWGRIIQSLL